VIAKPLLRLVGVIKDRKSQNDAENEAIPKHLGSMGGVFIRPALVRHVTGVAHGLVHVMCGVR
jgi:hypothetical protein